MWRVAMGPRLLSSKVRSWRERDQPGFPLTSFQLLYFPGIPEFSLETCRAGGWGVGVVVVVVVSCLIHSTPS